MFTKEQCTWNTLEYAENPSPTIVKRGFVRKYNIRGRQKVVCRPHSNRRNSRYQYVDSVKQGAEKVMCWAAIVDGRVLRLVWFE